MNPVSIVKNTDCMAAMQSYPYQYFDWCIADVPYGLNVGKMAFTQGSTTAAVKQRNGSRLRVTKEAYAVKDWDSRTPPQAYFDEVRRVSKNQIIFGVEYMAYCSSIETTVEIHLLWSGMNQAASIRTPTIQQGNKRLNEKRVHPTQKPVMLYHLLFAQFCQAGDRVLDTHLGSGSSRIAAYKMGFEFHGYEIDRDYYEASEKRFQSAVAMPLFD